MGFTSGGTGGPRFTRDERGEFDEDNVHGFLPSAGSAEGVAAALRGAGWRVRKCSWTEFEAEHTYAELTVMPGDPVIFSGIVVPERVDDLLAAFAGVGLRYVVELSDRGETTTYRS
jgi:hypothetical protein